MNTYLIRDQFPELTDREFQVAALVATGITQREAAEELGISLNTAKNFIRKISWKLPWFLELLKENNKEQAERAEMLNQSLFELNREWLRQTDRSEWKKLQTRKDHAIAKARYHSDSDYRDSVIGWTTAWTNKKCATDPVYRAVISQRRRLASLLRGKNPQRFIELLGCSLGEFRSYIADQFSDGMSWENYGLHTWHLDHITPASWYDHTDPEQVKACWHYSNFQPLWAAENLAKNNKFAG